MQSVFSLCSGIRPCTSWWGCKCISRTCSEHDCRGVQQGCQQSHESAPRHSQVILRRQVLPGLLKSQAAQSSSVATADGCSLHTDSHPDHTLTIEDIPWAPRAPFPRHQAVWHAEQIQS